MPRTLRWLLLAVVVTAVPVGIGVRVLDDEAPATPPPAAEPPAYASTALADYDTTTVTIDRAPFCDQIPEEALAEALAVDAGWAVTTYRNGQAAEIAPGVEDVAHEYGCRVEGAAAPLDGELRAWLFAPPVPRSRAAELVADAAGRAGCTRPAQAPAYGAPTLALVCPSGDRNWASFRGLFGDSWLACSLGAPDTLPLQELIDRAGRWCVAVAEAASAD